MRIVLAASSLKYRNYNGLYLQIDFLKAALEENVLHMVGCILQHVDNKKLRDDASVALDILYGVYVSFDPRTVLEADLQDAAQRSRCEFADRL
jgi:hypothetical protein